jgi:hypothetical protein
MPEKFNIPPALEPIRKAAMSALRPIKPADLNTQASGNFLFSAKRTEASGELPPYYLIYFLLVDLLGFENLGRFEKIAWSVPIDLRGRAFLIEYRKFGVGIFAPDPVEEEAEAREIVEHIKAAVKAAQPFFDWLADQAVAASAVNIVNNSDALFARFQYLRDAHSVKINEAYLRKDERHVEKHESESGVTWETISFPASRLYIEADWLAMAAIDAFFSWTEHIFIHLAILAGKITSAQEVASLAQANWATKFKAGLDITDPDINRSLSALITMRSELRNYVAHGAFGKQGEAFHFHSATGAVPVLLPHRARSKRFRLGEGLAFDWNVALQEIEQFISILWAGTRSPAQKYIQQSGLPIILTMVANGTYANAMTSDDEMDALIDHLGYQVDQAANMDW